MRPRRSLPPATAPVPATGYRVIRGPNTPRSSRALAAEARPMALGPVHAVDTEAPLDSADFAALAAAILS